MKAALSLGRRGMGRVWPNPAVGCVIVKDGIVVGRGRTADGGRPHAEVVALAQAGAAARGATAYVTLEPCAHTGQTGPCADALSKAGVRRVIVATSDPDPRVCGGGIEMLRAAGIEVEVGICQSEADHDHAGFFQRIERSRPFVTLKLALSLDGRIATRTGDSQWITGPEARQMVHAMRARHDAVLVGGGTARADNPALNVRGWGDVPQPVRVVMSRSGDFPTDGVLAQTAASQPVWLLHAAACDASRWDETDVKCIKCTSDQIGNVDVKDALTHLAAAGLTRVFCEGGGKLAASLVAADCVDELVVFSGGVALGADGLAGMASLGLDKLADAPRFSLQELRQIGADTYSVWRPNTA